MVILGIESSCDETAAAVVADGREIRANVVSSSEAFHRAYGGIVPELASRKSCEAILPVLEATLTEAKIAPADLDAVAVVNGPGLIGSLVVGLMAAKTFAWVHGLPLVGVNHLEGHLYANWLDIGRTGVSALPPALPALVLIVSGGHAHLVWMQDHGQYRILGRTRDDAPGEALDKAARLLDLGYPGGSIIDKLAKEGNPAAVPFPRALLPGSYDFSFSGVKTSLALYLKKTTPVVAGLDSLRNKSAYPQAIQARDYNLRASVPDIAASFQEAIMSVLVEKLFAAAEELNPAQVVLAGGVAANSRLRALASARAKRDGIPLALPPRALCTDNAAMVAAAGYFKAARGEYAPPDLDAVAALPLA